LYAQAISGNIKEILKLKNNFPNLLSKKIEDIHRTINNSGKTKPHINMTTKDSSYKQIIIPMGSNNSKKFMKSLDDHVTNLNHALKSIKSDTIVDFICIDHCGLIVTANKIAIPSELCVVENYIKNITSVDSNDIQSACCCGNH